MLYVSTRSKTESFTAYRVLHENTTPDGGLFLPMRLPELTDTERAELAGASFSENIARILNLFYGTGLTGWDIECCVGKNPCRMVSMNRKILVAELWHNFGSSFDAFYRAAASRLTDADPSENSWLRISVNVAVLFGIYAQCAQQIPTPDICLDTDDFTTLIALTYARKMGLPFENGICCLKKNSFLWSFLHHGELSTVNPVPRNLERFLYDTLGFEETQRYLEISRRKGLYHLNRQQFSAASQLLSPVVVGKERIGDVIRSVYRTNSYIMDSAAAMTYGGLQDYRAGAGESRPTILLSLTDPRQEAELVSGAIGADPDSLFGI